MKNKEKSVFRKDAVTLVDILFDKGLFTDSVTRKDMRTVEDLICMMMDSRYESHIKIEELMKSISKGK